MADPGVHADWLAPQGFAAPVGAVMSTRLGGVSGGPWAGMNLGDACGDAADAVKDAASTN